ncbi:hypothetical protein GGU11DRAFT_323160 [Lentinula aff. detonsa]|uniref:DUF866-domain-containing protein n=1 Tax=Lentinula aff. detonsa TaxID=2804958 RepID=A0AA38L2B0_9AGAR|nr:hypothetical protein GGU10DRAFT_97537 [Lentinula aff. detonsa]KAJ3794324.1 hypothetical protein GGU11DRAFT_323160 [Lentinula aff. detonsa]
MVMLLLSIKAELENVSDLAPEDDDFEYFFQVKCTSCNEIHSKHVSLNRREEYDVSGGKGGKAHFVWKCGLCKRESSAKFDATSPPKPYNAENGQLAPFLKIECRGLEFIGFDPRGMWKCVGTKGTSFSEVDLSEEEWTDYDEKAALPVGVSEFGSAWSRA